MAPMFIHRSRHPRQAYPKSLVNALGIALEGQYHHDSEGCDQARGWMPRTKKLQHRAKGKLLLLAYLFTGRGDQAGSTDLQEGSCGCPSQTLRSSFVVDQ